MISNSFEWYSNSISYQENETISHTSAIVQNYIKKIKIDTEGRHQNGGGGIHEKNQIYLVAKFHWFIFFPKEVKVNVSMISEQPSYVRNVAAVDGRLSPPSNGFPLFQKQRREVHMYMSICLIWFVLVCFYK